MTAARDRVRAGRDPVNPPTESAQPPEYDVRFRFRAYRYRAKHRKVPDRKTRSAAGLALRATALSGAVVSVAAGVMLIDDADAVRGMDRARIIDLSVVDDADRRAAAVRRADRAARPAASPQAAAAGGSASPSRSPSPSPTPKPPAEKVLKYDFQEQPNSYYCGPAATYNALTAQGIKIAQDELARRLGTDFRGTRSAHDVTRVLNGAIGKEVYQTREIRGTATSADMDRLQEDVVRAISNGYAVVANVVGGTTDAAGIWRGYPGGHYVTIVGYRDSGRSVKVADPAGIGGDGTYWVSTIKMATWMSTRGYSA